MRRKILIADDPDLAAAMVEATLAHDGVTETLIARDGEEALQVARQEAPDLIFLGMLMPKLNGYEVCQELKRDPATAGIKVVICCMPEEFPYLMTLPDIRADDYVAKPFLGSMLRLMDGFALVTQTGEAAPRFGRMARKTWC